MRPAYWRLARRYLTLKEFGSARTFFENCLLINPRSAEAFIGLADLQIAIGDRDESLKSLRNAREMAPNNRVIRERLALNLAFSNSGKSLEDEKKDWHEIDSLLSSGTEPATARDVFISALVGMNRGDKERLKAIEKLRGLAQALTPEGLDAKRLLTNYYVQQFLEKSEGNQPEAAVQNLKSASQLYEELLELNPTNPQMRHNMSIFY